MVNAQFHSHLDVISYMRLNLDLFTYADFVTTPSKFFFFDLVKPIVYLYKDIL